MVISVITAVKNPPAGIVEHCHEVQNQRGVEVEHLVADGSERPLAASLQNRIKENGSRYLWKPDDGFYQGINNGISLARGDYIHILNLNDGYKDHNVLNRISKELRSDRINACAVETFERGKCGGKPFGKWRLFLNQRYLPHPGLILSRQLIEEVGSYKENYKVAGDSEYIFRCMRHFKIHSIPGVLVKMGKSGISGTYQKTGYNEYREILKKEYEIPVLFDMIYYVRVLTGHAKGK